MSVTSTPAGYITLAEANAITGLTPSEFTDHAFQTENSPEEFVPRGFQQRSDGTLRELTRSQVANFPLNERLPLVLVLESEAHEFVAWNAAEPARRAIENARAEEIAEMDQRGSGWH